MHTTCFINQIINCLHFYPVHFFYTYLTNNHKANDENLVAVFIAGTLSNVMLAEVPTSMRSSSSHPPNSCPEWLEASNFSQGLKRDLSVL